MALVWKPVQQRRLIVHKYSAIAKSGLAHSSRSGKGGPEEERGTATAVEKLCGAQVH